MTEDLNWEKYIPDTVGWVHYDMYDPYLLPEDEAKARQIIKNCLDLNLLDNYALNNDKYDRMIDNRIDELEDALHMDANVQLPKDYVV